MRPLSGMSVLITGGGSGIGQATALLLASGGARVTVCGRRTEKLAETVERSGGSVLAVQADVTSARDRQRAIAASHEFGGGLDGLVSNAANMYRMPIDHVEEDAILQLFRDNVVSGMMLVKEALPLLERARGAVVFMGSTYTKRGIPGASAYAASKAALETLTGVLASELGPRGVRVNCVSPGAVLTEIHERQGVLDADQARTRLQSIAGWHALLRCGTPLEIAEGIEYLLRAEWVTGEVLAVDGGLRLGHSHDVDPEQPLLI